jgi:molecular chaperone GrpE
MSGSDKPTVPGQPEKLAEGTESTQHPAATPEPEPGQQSPASETATTLEARVKELESQQADLTDRLLRAHAEMENVRKRTEREKVESAKYAISRFALDIVGIGDNFKRAMTAVPAGAVEQDPALKSLVDGVQMTERAFLQVLERHGVRRIDPLGELFDPNLHQAVMEQENPEVPAGTVLNVFQPGYMIEDRVLRPAMVVVARGGNKPVRRNGEPGAEPSPQGGAPGGTSGDAAA